MHVIIITPIAFVALALMPGYLGSKFTENTHLYTPLNISEFLAQTIYEPKHMNTVKSNYDGIFQRKLIRRDRKISAPTIKK